MTERPILFSGPMVRAIITGHKTVTRRLITVPWGKKGRALPFPPYYDGGDGTLHVADEYGDWHDFAKHVRCPYGRAGDRLWVRETWQVVTGWQVGDLGAAVRYQDMGIKACQMPEDKALPLCLTWDRWRPSIHMPHWASRLTLEVTGIRVERLQELTGEDALAEGVTLPPGGKAETFAILRHARSSFASLWDEISGDRPGASWEANPWVWVISFRRVEVAP